MSFERITNDPDRPLPEVDEDYPVYVGVPSEDRTMAILSHIGGYFTSFIVPMVLYLSAKGRSPFTDQHNREALNLQLTLLVYYLLMTVGDAVILVAAGMTIGWEWALVVSGSIFAFMTIVFGIWETICIVVACVAAYRGRLIHLPAVGQFVGPISLSDSSNGTDRKVRRTK